MTLLSNRPANLPFLGARGLRPGGGGQPSSAETRGDLLPHGSRRSGHRHGSQLGILGQNSQKMGLLKTEIPGSCPLSSKYLEFLSKERLTTPKLALLDRLLSLCSFQPTFFSGFWQEIFGF